MKLHVFTLCVLMVFVGTACSTAPKTTEGRQEIVDTSHAKLALLKAENKALYKTYNNSSIAVAVFPSVGKGGLIVGGAYGKGVLFEKGKTRGYVNLTQGTLGAQIGGQAYTQFVFIKDKATLTKFKNGSLDFSAQVSAVAANADVNNAAYTDGVAVVIMDAKGLMAEATVSGQKFKYVPADAFE